MGFRHSDLFGAQNDVGGDGGGGGGGLNETGVVWLHRSLILALNEVLFWIGHYGKKIIPFRRINCSEKPETE